VSLVLAFFVAHGPATRLARRHPLARQLTVQRFLPESQAHPRVKAQRYGFPLPLFTSAQKRVESERPGGFRPAKFR